MPYSEAVIERARKRLEQEKIAKERENAARRDEAYRSVPRLREIDRLLRMTSAKAIAVSFDKGENQRNQLEELRTMNQDLQNERSWLLETNGYEDGWLDDTPICEQCGGRGYVGSSMCSCLKELCRQEQKKELTSLLSTGRESFDNLRLDVYPDTCDPQIGVSARRVMASIFAECRHYCANFTPGSESLLFSGATGLGKTFLSACIARQIADRGYSVVYVNAIRMIEDFEAMKFGKRSDEDPNLTARYLQTDLLIIDDLGMEMSTQFNISTLYTVIDRRMVAGKPTIISTNMEPEQLQNRYSPQIASRLLGTYRLYQFYGTDIRMRDRL